MTAVLSSHRPKWALIAGEASGRHSAPPPGGDCSPRGCRRASGLAYLTPTRALSRRGGGRHRKRLLVLLHLVDLLREEAVRFAVNRVRRLGAGRLDQAEDLARLRVVPVLEIANAMLLSRLQVLLVRAGDVPGRCPGDVPVAVHVDRHVVFLLRA